MALADQLDHDGCCGWLLLLLLLLRPHARVAGGGAPS
jgi:hypothetical protein